MKMKEKTKTLGFYTLTLSFISIFFLSCTDNKNLPQKNLQNFSTNSCYIYTDIKYKDSTYIVVIGNNSFFEIIKKQNHWTKFEYRLRMTFNIKHNKAIEVNNKSFSNLKSSIIDNKYIRLYDKSVIVNDTNLIMKKKFVNPRLPYDKTKALIYVLLKNKINNCYLDCESGAIILENP